MTNEEKKVLGKLLNSGYKNIRIVNIFNSIDIENGIAVENRTIYFSCKNVKRHPVAESIISVSNKPGEGFLGIFAELLDLLMERYIEELDKQNLPKD